MMPPPVIPRVEVATHLVEVPVDWKTIPSVPALLLVSRSARAMVRSVTVAPARVEVLVTRKVPATESLDAGEVEPIPMLPVESVGPIPSTLLPKIRLPILSTLFSVVLAALISEPIKIPRLTVKALYPLL